MDQSRSKNSVIQEEECPMDVETEVQEVLLLSGKINDKDGEDGGKGSGRL